MKPAQFHALTEGEPFRVLSINWDHKQKPPHVRVTALTQILPCYVEDNFGGDSTFAVFTSEPVTPDEAEALLPYEDVAGVKADQNGIASFASKDAALKACAALNETTSGNPYWARVGKKQSVLLGPFQSHEAARDAAFAAHNDKEVMTGRGKADAYADLRWHKNHNRAVTEGGFSVWCCPGCGGKRSNLVIDPSSGEVSTVRGAAACLECGNSGGYEGYPPKYEGADLEKLRKFNAARTP